MLFHPVNYVFREKFSPFRRAVKIFRALFVKRQAIGTSQREIRGHHFELDAAMLLIKKILFNKLLFKLARSPLQIAERERVLAVFARQTIKLVRHPCGERRMSVVAVWIEQT